MLIEQLVTRTIYEAIRQLLVIEEWLPDIDDFDVENPDEEIAGEAYESYQGAIKAIADGDKGYSIELFNYSDSQTKGYKKVPRIVIHALTMIPGEVGNDPSVYYERQGDYFILKQDSPSLADFSFMVYAVGNRSDQIYVMNDIIMRTLGHKGYIKRYIDETLKLYNNFFVSLRDKGETEGLSEGTMERFYRYMIPDLNEVPTLVLERTVPPINEITLDTELL